MSLQQLRLATQANTNGNKLYVGVYTSPATASGSFTVNVSTGSVSGGTLALLNGNFPAGASVIHMAAQQSHDEPGSHAGASNPSVTISGVSQPFTASSTATVNVSNNGATGYTCVGVVIFIGVVPD